MTRAIRISVALALAAGGMGAALTREGSAHWLLWAPAVIAALPLLTPASVWPARAASVWLWVFTVLGGFSVGMLYLPSAVAMLVAASVGESARQEGVDRARLGVYVAFAITIAVSTAWALHMVHTDGFRWPAWAFLAAPTLAASLPLWWRNAGSAATAATLLAGCAFFPITVEMGASFLPAVVVLGITAAAAR